MGRSLGVTLFGVYLVLAAGRAAYQHLGDAVSQRSLEHAREVERTTRAKLRNGAWSGQQAVQAQSEFLPLLEGAKTYLSSPRAAMHATILGGVYAVQALAGFGLLLRAPWSRGLAIGSALGMIAAYGLTTEYYDKSTIADAWKPATRSTERHVKVVEPGRTVAIPHGEVRVGPTVQTWETTNDPSGFSVAGDTLLVKKIGYGLVGLQALLICWIVNRRSVRGHFEPLQGPHL